MLPSSLFTLILVIFDLRHVLAIPTTARQMIPVDTRDAPDVSNANGKRHADFSEVRTRLRKDHSGAKGDPKEKYFHEATFHPHYDGRFAEKVLPEDLRDHALTAMVRTYLETMSELGAETWLMHGSLLGWWWNRKILPWDSDIDVQISLESMNYLAAYHNMTVHHYSLPPPPGRNHSDGDIHREYLLEINPNYVNGSTADRLNRIDARWIDTDTGLFIDITTLRPDEDAAAQGRLGRMMSKDNHHYLEQDIFPLRRSEFEGVQAKIPYAYSELLEEEYGRASLTRTSYEGHLFDQASQLWVPLRPDSPLNVPDLPKWVPPERKARSP